MSKNNITSLRNMAIVGHGGAGKTTLSEAMLMEVGLVNRVPAGILDYASDEKEREHSIDSALAQFSSENCEMTLIDNPGYQDFIQNAINSLSVVETSICVISASDGITINTRKVWEQSRKNNIASLIVITKLDNDNVTLDGVVTSIQEEFGEKCLPYVVCNDVGGKLSEVYRVSEREDNSSLGYKKKLIEAIVETDDQMISRYFDGEEIPLEDLKRQFKKIVHQGKIFPILVAVPNRNIGIKELITCIENLCPSPMDVIPKKGQENGKEISFEVSPDAPFSAQVFKIFNDPFGRVSYFRIYSGTLASASTIHISNTEASERIGQLTKTIGKEQKPVDKASAGEIVSVVKIEGTQINYTLTEEKSKFKYPDTIYPSPMVPLAVEPLTRTDEQKISAALGKLSEEDPTFLIKRHEETSELIVSGMSSLHLDIILNRLKSRFKVESKTKIPKIPYRETITSKKEARHRHKKQSGGHGQFGEVAIKVEPTERGQKFEFVNQIVGGVIPSQFVASTEKGILNTLEKGIIAGYPIVDVRVTLFDGKTHDVDSSDAAFQVAGSKAFQEAFMDARPALLEPIQSVKVMIPNKFMGDIMGDLNTRRGRIVGTDSGEKFQIVEALVPLSEMVSYSADLKGITGAEGSFTMEFSHYDVVPSNLQDKIIAKSKQDNDK